MSAMDDTIRARAAETARRIETVRRLLEQRGAGVALLGSRRNFAWLTVGGLNHVVLASEGGAVPLLISRTDAVALAPVNEAPRMADEELDGLPIEVRALPWHDGAAAEREAKRVDATMLSDADLEDSLVTERSRLGPIEVGRMTVLARLASDAVAAALEEIRPGDDENDAVASVVATLARAGVRAPVLLAAADGRIERYRHPLPAGATIRRRLMLVLVAERWGMHAAVTRIRELETPSADLAERNTASDRVLDAMHGATRAGATLGDVLNAARTAYRDAGFADEWELHHQGGTIGYQGRERIAVPGDATRIEPGMAFAWNPSITGAKAEETSLLVADGDLRLVTAVG